MFTLKVIDLGVGFGVGVPEFWGSGIRLTPRPPLK